MLKVLEEYKKIHSGHLKRSRTAIVNGYWHLKENRLNFKAKYEDFGLIQTMAESVLNSLETLIQTVEGDRDKPGVQVYINEIVSTIDIHLDRITKYYTKNAPSGFKSKENQREEARFQLLVFKGEQKIKSDIRKLNIENDMSNLIIEFNDNRIATLPMKEILYERSSKIAKKIDSLKIDWDLIMNNGFFINMKKSEIPEYNASKHFWDQDIETLQFWVSEYNKVKNGITIDGYKISPWIYFHLNFFKTPIKNKKNKILNPDFRDNEFYIDSVKTYAEKKAKELEPAAILFYGSRRYAKTTSEASYCHHGMLCYPTQSGNISSSNADDLASIIDKVKKSLDNIVPAFKVDIIAGKDWKKNVFFGIKSKSGAEIYEHFVFNIKNIDSGSKTGSQVKAGGNPVVSVDDEIGKSSFISAHEAAIPAFESDDGWVCQPWYTGTSGNEDLSSDAQKVLNDPRSYSFIEIDWDILEYGIPKEEITWERRTFCWFLPAQMSVKTGLRKIKTNLADYVGVESEELKKIAFYKTDWKHNNAVIKKRRKELTGDALVSEKVFRPIDPEECFMSAKSNPLPGDAAKKHSNRIKAEFGKEGKARLIDLYRDKDRNVHFNLSNKNLAEFPHKGGFVDAPFQLFADFPKEKPKRFRYIAGLDDYKQEESSGDSIGSFYIFDRLTRKIVLSLATRPDPHSSIFPQIHMALDAYNAICFPENEDMDIKKYFDRLHMSEFYLGKGFDVTSQFNLPSNAKRKFGWQPSKINTPFVIGLVKDYCKHQIDIFDEKENVIETRMGVERIDDLHLLEEIIKFKPNGNFDRIISFGSVLLYDHYLTSKFIVPSSEPEKKLEDKPKIYQPRNKVFSNVRRNPFYSK